jgi:hypothetical protein
VQVVTWTICTQHIKHDIGWAVTLQYIKVATKKCTVSYN